MLSYLIDARAFAFPRAKMTRDSLYLYYLCMYYLHSGLMDREYCVKINFSVDRSKLRKRIIEACCYKIFVKKNVFDRDINTKFLGFG